jgi:hypothetical protein
MVPVLGFWQVACSGRRVRRNDERSSISCPRTRIHKYQDFQGTVPELPIAHITSPSTRVDYDEQMDTSLLVAGVMYFTEARQRKIRIQREHPSGRLRTSPWHAPLRQGGQHQQQDSCLDRERFAEIAARQADTICAYGYNWLGHLVRAFTHPCTWHDGLQLPGSSGHLSQLTQAHTIQGLSPYEQHGRRPSWIVLDSAHQTVMHLTTPAATPCSHRACHAMMPRPTAQARI